MNRRNFAVQAALLGFSALTLAPFSARAQSAQTTAPRNRIVVQVSDNDPAKWNLALNNIRNLQEDVGANNVEIELVAYGPGIGMLKLDSPVVPRISAATKAGVKVLACENTMKGQKLTRDDMAPDISYVPAGVTEIMKKQVEGWAYLRP